MTTTTALCVRSTLHKLTLTDSVGDGWSSGSKITVSLGLKVLGEYTLSSGSSMDSYGTVAIILLHRDSVQKDQLVDSFAYAKAMKIQTWKHLSC